MAIVAAPRAAGLRRRRRWTVAVGVVALLAVGCGDDGGDETVSDLAGDLRSEGDLQGISFTAAEARCTAERVVADLGAERVEATGLVGEDEVGLADLDDAEVGAVAAALEGCVDGMEAELTDAVRDGILESSTSSMPIDEAQARCVAREVVDALGVRRLLVIGAGADAVDPLAGGVVGDDEAQVIAERFLRCVDIRSVLVQQFVAEGVPAETAECLAAEIDDERLLALFSAEFTGEEVDPDQVLGPAREACGI